MSGRLNKRRARARRSTVFLHAINVLTRVAILEDGEIGRSISFHDADGEDCDAQDAIFCVAKFGAGFVPICLADFGPATSH